jgi:hypothetical protein
LPVPIDDATVSEALSLRDPLPLSLSESVTNANVAQVSGSLPRFLVLAWSVRPSM